VSIYLAIWLPLLAASILLPDAMREFNAHAAVFWIGGLAILVLGVIDDLHPLTSVPKLVVQIVVGSLFYWAGIGFDRLWIPFVGGLPLGLFAWPITVLWFLLLVNAVNIIDGIDGLAASTTAVGCISLIWVSWDIQLPPVWIGAGALLGGLIIFLRYNRPPAEVFMGDSGSLSIGYFFAMVALFAPIKRFTALAFFVPILALMLPLLESAFSVGRRSLARSNPFRGDTGHLHNQLQRAGLTDTQILLIYNGIAATVGVFCVGFRFANRRILAILLGIFVLSVLVGLGIILRRRKQDADKSAN
jgi:UDP-GlcNAc:undecaprenyl-phosphate GlcNAc-1-phosphate transferase